MTAIPGDIPLDAPSAPPPSTATIQPSDLGLDHAGAVLGAVAEGAKRVQAVGIRAQAIEDRKAIAPNLLDLQNQNMDAFAKGAAGYTGQPGFAKAQIADANARLATSLAAPGLTPGQRAELRNAGNAEVTRLGQQAIEHEARVMAAPIAAATEATQQTQLGGALAQQQAAFGPEQESLYRNITPGMDLPGQIGAAYDKHAAEAVAALPANLQGPAQLEFAKGRVGAVAKAQEFQLTHAVAQTATGVNNNVGTLVNGVVSAPSTYDDALGKLPALLAPLGSTVGPEALHDARAQLAVGRIKGLVDAGQQGLAAAELKAGKYDADLKPEQKESLSAEVGAAVMRVSPKSSDQAMAQYALRARMDAEVTARLTTGRSTGQANLDDVAAQLGGEEEASYATKLKLADQEYAAAGGVRDMPSDQVASLAHAAPPPPETPDYANQLAIYQTRAKAAQDELAARQQPGAWAFASNGKGNPTRGPGAVGLAAAQDRGAALQAMWQAAQAGGPGQVHAGAVYAGSMLGVQYAAGIPAEQRQIVPPAEAARLAGSVINAPPEGKLAALQGLAQVRAALPTDMHTPDGQSARPRAIFDHQLLDAHLTPVELSAIADYGDDPTGAKLGRVVAALNDTTLKTPMKPGDRNALALNVRNAVGPYLATAAALPGSSVLAQARIDRTTLVARELMATQHMDPAMAAVAAAQDFTSGYRYVDSWRMPANLAGGFTSTQLTTGDGAQVAKVGAAQLLAQITANKGAALYAPATLPGTPDNRRHLYASQITANGRWVTSGDDAGLQLLTPKPDGTWTPVTDRYGKPVTASWSMLRKAAGADGGLSGPAFGAPPPNALNGPDAKPLPAVSRQSAFSALAYAVNVQESGAAMPSGLKSPAGALGQMGLMPDTVKTYAPRLGLPVDLDRAQHDDAYNRQLGNAALADSLGHYGQGAGIGLALAAYNAGRGRLDGYTDAAGYHPGWLQTIGDPRTGRISLDDFVRRIPYPETRAYVQAVLPRALARLQANH